MRTGFQAYKVSLGYWLHRYIYIYTHTHIYMYIHIYIFQNMLNHPWELCVHFTTIKIIIIVSNYYLYQFSITRRDGDFEVSTGERRQVHMQWTSFPLSPSVSDSDGWCCVNLVKWKQLTPESLLCMFASWNQSKQEFAQDMEGRSEPVAYRLWRSP